MAPAWQALRGLERALLRRHQLAAQVFRRWLLFLRTARLAREIEVDSLLQMERELEGHASRLAERWASERPLQL